MGLLAAVAVCALAGLAADVGATTAPVVGSLTPVSSANSKTPGIPGPNILSKELEEVVLAQGSFKLENPDRAVGSYGYDTNGPFVPLPAAPTTEASKTEPDKNTYLVIKGGLAGADPSYSYGTHFLFQGHEGGTIGYLTRINLDADGAHRVTLLATKDMSGAALPVFDGSSWDPFAGRLLFSAERGSSGGIRDATLDVPAKVRNLQPFIGRGGFEGMQTDADGNVWIVEDVGGATGTGANSKARRPNSFVYRFVPHDKRDLTQGGKMQALEVRGTGGSPITFDTSLTADQASFSAGVGELERCGLSLTTRWITIATTNAASTLPGPDDNALAKAAGATPFKRPENGQFRPGSRFTEFFFDETGDTNADSSANAGFGGWGSIQRLTLDAPGGDTGHLSLFYASDKAHSGFDNVAFFDRDHISFVEDAGDTLHTQRNALDSAYMFDVNQSYCGTDRQPLRWLAEGRDPSATLDSALQGTPGFQNEGDNEITGIHVSDGDPTVNGLIGGHDPHAFDAGWRVFWTQQHGDNDLGAPNRLLTTTTDIAAGAGRSGPRPTRPRASRCGICGRSFVAIQIADLVRLVVHPEMQIAFLETEVRPGSSTTQPHRSSSTGSVWRARTGRFRPPKLRCFLATGPISSVGLGSAGSALKRLPRHVPRGPDRHPMAGGPGPAG